MRQIAVVGLACKYPDADNYQQLWENVLARRRAFRNMPSERLDPSYFSEDGNPDTVYINKAAVLRDYHFNREAFKISGASYRTADMAHWLALDMAHEALTDAGAGAPVPLNLEKTGVFIGNTLTGEFTRANLTRLRWPYVARTLYQQLLDEGWERGKIKDFLNAYEVRFKEPFPAMQEDSLAGGLSNTIAGRICNYFDFKGGGYTVDGACSSSLLAVENACAAIANGELDAALVGGVDLSLDPFELVGFSRAGALSKTEMKVYDKRSAGFWPGEGCGFIVLMELEEAIAGGMDIRAVIRGWGISSDGQGGLTRPVLDGQLLAMDRAYQKAGYEMSSIAYMEGHGTGTRVGDETELKTISAQIDKGGLPEQPIALGAIKANIGHTKAAAGIAGLIKAIMVVDRQVIPPASGVYHPNSIIENNQNIELPIVGHAWNRKQPMRASVSAMGFGGINAHITIEGYGGSHKTELSPAEIRLLAAYQDAELFLFSGDSATELTNQIETILPYANDLSISELTDLSCALYGACKPGKWRAAVVASQPNQFAERLNMLHGRLLDGTSSLNDGKHSIYLSNEAQPCRIGFLFPGQGGQLTAEGGIYAGRFPSVRPYLVNPEIKGKRGILTTDIVQPAMVRNAVAALKIMNGLDLHGTTAVGHSVGELSALYWSGTVSEKAIISFAQRRGQLMQQFGEADGGMMSIARSANEVGELIAGTDVVIAGLNSTDKTVVAGPIDQLNALHRRLKADGVGAILLNVSHAFHSPMMEAVKEPMLEALEKLHILNSDKAYYSTVTGRKTSSEGTDVHVLLNEQLTEPVRFVEAIENADKEVDLWVELGSGRTLEGLVSSLSDKPVYATEIGGISLKGLLNLVAHLFATGNEVNLDFLFKHRFHRSFDLNWNASFLVNPCELPNTDAEVDVPLSSIHVAGDASDLSIEINPSGPAPSTMDYLRQVLARKIELPLETVTPESKMLDDLHLNSITVGQLIAEVARSLDIPMTQTPTEYANASVTEIAAALEQLKGTRDGLIATQDRIPEGISNWIRPYRFRKVRSELSPGDPGANPLSDGQWNVVLSAEGTSPKHIEDAAAALPGEGTIVVVSGDDPKEVSEALIEASQMALTGSGQHRLVVVQGRPVASGFAKSFFLEHPDKDVLVLNFEAFPEEFDLLSGEVASLKGFREVFFNKAGQRYEQEMEVLSMGASDDRIATVQQHDLVLVSGGGKGITAECAIAMAKETGCRLAIVGRSQPDRDKKLEANLERMKRNGIAFRYYSADVADVAQVKALIDQIESDQGAIRGLLHGAGANRPIAVGELTWEKVNATLQPKLFGLRNLLQCIDPANLKTLVTFGSIIARSGMNGNADYAFANELMANEVDRWKAEHSDCVCRNIEWSVWSGTGMGDELGVLEQLRMQGIQPITIDKGIAIFRDLLNPGLPDTHVVVSGRNGFLPTLRMQEAKLPLHRFLENIRIHYPGVELIADATISSINDPYLEDHRIDGQQVMPAVIGMEAMVQVASALQPVKDAVPSFKKLEFLTPIVVADRSEVQLRIIGEVRPGGACHVVLRSDTSGFSQDHFRGICTFEDIDLRVPERPYTNGHLVNLSPEKDLYGNILFHTGRFQCLGGYKILSPYSSISYASTDQNTDWFGGFLSQELLLGSPALRDTALHAVQACVPQRTLLPVSVECVRCYRQLTQDVVFIYAKELQHEGDRYTYDICIYDQKDNPLEVWEGVVFQALQKPNGKYFRAALGEVILKRQLDEMGKMGIQLTLNEDGVNAAGSASDKRPDGKPLMRNGQQLSRSGSSGWTFEVTGDLPVGCDLELVSIQSKEIWETMLGVQRFQLARSISRDLDEDLDIACTRVWGAIEGLKKAGEHLNTPLTFEATSDSGTIHFSSGSIKALSTRFVFRESGEEMIATVLFHDEEAHSTKTMINRIK